VDPCQLQEGYRYCATNSTGEAFVGTEENTTDVLIGLYRQMKERRGTALVWKFQSRIPVLHRLVLASLRLEDLMLVVSTHIIDTVRE
jgi:hypothetical protein